MKAVVYARFSPRRDADTSESCELQLSLCRQHAEKKGWTIRSEHADKAKSGKDATRPGLANAISELCRGDVFLVYKWDRIARDVLISELTRRQVKAKGARVVALQGDIKGDDKDPTVIFVRQIMNAVAELERKQIAKRTKDAMLQHQRNGRRMGRFAPYGYAVNPEDETKIVIDSDEQEAIRTIKELHKSGKTVYNVVKTMNEHFIELARGERWLPRTVKKIIEREINTVCQS